MGFVIMEDSRKFYYVHLVNDHYVGHAILRYRSGFNSFDTVDESDVLKVHTDAVDVSDESGRVRYHLIGKVVAMFNSDIKLIVP